MSSLVLIIFNGQISKKFNLVEYSLSIFNPLHTFVVIPQICSNKVTGNKNVLTERELSVRVVKSQRKTSWYFTLSCLNLLKTRKVNLWCAKWSISTLKNRLKLEYLHLKNVLRRPAMVGYSFIHFPDFQSPDFWVKWLGRSALIKSCGITKEFIAMIWKLQAVVFFLFSFFEETKVEVDTTSIILSYIYHPGNINK